jgi:hypothetical protein
MELLLLSMLLVATVYFIGRVCMWRALNSDNINHSEFWHHKYLIIDKKNRQHLSLTYAVSTSNNLTVNSYETR